MTDPNIHEHVRAICEAVGLEPNHVRRMDITPREIVAEVFLLNESGAKYVDGATDEVATETRTFAVVA